MKRKARLWLGKIGIVALAAAVTSAAWAEVKLAKVFGGNMVLQRDMKAPVWGWADPGEQVTVEFAGQKKTATADAKGAWKLTLDPLPASAEPRTVTVTGSIQNQESEIQNVLVGEVWLCSGQSNMQWSVTQSADPEKEVAEAKFPQIRFLSIPRVPSGFPATDVQAAWQVCSPETTGAFSACAYFFGRHLHRELNVPVGLINSSWGGTRIEPWTPPVGFAAAPALATFHQQVILTDPHSAAYKDTLGKYLADAEAWLKTARQALATEAPLTAMPAYPPPLAPLTSHGHPSTLYNGMIHPLVPFALRGAIWYQGESNHREGMLYTEKTKALVGGWRQVWGQGDFPFYYVQIAPYVYGNEDPYILPEFWEAQTAALSIPNTGMAVIHDIGNVNDIHPKNKQDVGKRLALLALAKTYGRKEVVWSGPTFKEMKIEGGRIRVRFDNAGGGLASRDGKPLTYFEVIGEDTEWFVKAEAVIEGDSVLVSAADCKQPLAVRFAWHRNAEPNLMNKEGLPAGAFRAGKAPERDLLTMKIAEAKDYQLVYALDLAKLGADIRYDVDARDKVVGPFDRIAYFLELQKAGEPVKYAYVSMDAFTAELAKIGVPTVASKAKFQQKVANLNVISNVEGIVTGAGLKGGNIEFWPHNYGPPNSAAIPNASSELWDFGDEIALPED
ncbi:MAG: sialate O-acetylesterase, partial [Planctomycetes bacterium]|nr:sialate O-acetylesterase [Planctomycetota bacterium]